MFSPFFAEALLIAIVLTISIRSITASKDTKNPKNAPPKERAPQGTRASSTPFQGLRALPVGTVNVQLPRRSLRGSYSHGVSRLDSEDVTTLTNDYLNAYRRCVAEAYNMVGYFAPVLARAALPPDLHRFYH